MERSNARLFVQLHIIVCKRTAALGPMRTEGGVSDHGNGFPFSPAKGYIALRGHSSLAAAKAGGATTL